MIDFVKNKWLKEILKIFLIMFGVCLMGFAFNSFFYANDIAPGGFGGLAIVFSNLFNKLNWFYVSPTIIYLILNAILMCFAFKLLGKKCFIYSLLGILAYSLCIEFFKFDLNLNDKFLAALFGAVLTGVGVGIVVRSDGSTGGSELLGLILHSFNRNITVGKVLIIVDSLVLILNFATSGLISSLYTLFAIYLSGKIADIVIEGGKGTKVYYIISDKYEEISSAIVQKLSHGATIINGKGAYSKTDKNILMCLVNKYEARDLKQIVFNTDDKALLFSTSVVEAYGKGFVSDSALKAKKPKKIEYINKDVKVILDKNGKVYKSKNKIEDDMSGKND